MRMIVSKRPTWTAMLLMAASVAGAAQSPLPVSPGDATKLAEIEDVCPTFSWSVRSGAQQYEVVVVRATEVGEEPTPVVRRTLTGTVSSWTPSLEHCLERGLIYAWSVRAAGREGWSAWSAPSFFRVAAGPDETEFREAVEVVREYLAGNDADGGEPEPAAKPAWSQASPQPGRPAAPPVLRGVETAPSAGPTGSDIVTDGQYRFDTSRFFSQYLPAASFSLQVNEDDTYLQTADGYGYIQSFGDLSVELFAPVHAPEHGVLSEFHCSVYDATDSGFYTITMEFWQRLSVPTATRLAEQTLSSMPAETPGLETFFVPVPTAFLLGFNYIRVLWTQSGEGDDLRFYGCQVVYSTDLSH